MTMTEGPTGPKIGAPELLMTSAASLPARSAHGIFALGAGHRVQPRSEGELYRAAVGAPGSSLPQAGRARRRVWCTDEEDCKGLSYPVCVPCTHPAWAAGLPRSQRPGQEPFRPLSPLLHPWPVSSLGVPAQLWLPWALCCTYSRLVFIPCEDDILFLLSVSVFMCEELLACCARARGELVPRD